MEFVRVILQIIIALAIFNVWILRYGKETRWRGGTARNMREEFEFYGLSAGFMQVIGVVKVLLAVLLVAGIWLPALTRPAAIGMCMLMLGAVSMHIKVKDPLAKSLPAFTLLVLSSIVAVL